MRIVAIRERTVPIGTSMHNAAISFDTMTASAVAVVTDRIVDGEPIIGYAFDSIGRYGKGGLLRERFMPRLLAASPEALVDPEHGLLDPEACWRVAMANEKPGGHGERPGAIGVLDAAIWDARAKALGLPLWRVIAQRYGNTAVASPEIAVYGSCGHMRNDEGMQALTDEVKRCRDSGYPLVKIKVSGDIDLDRRRIEAGIRAVGDAAHLAVDANGALRPAQAIEWTAAIDALRLAWIEEPAAPLDYATHAALASTTRSSIATGENLMSLDDALNLLRYGGLRPDHDRLQFDVSLAYGIPEYARIIAAYEAAGWSRRAFWPHAGHLFAAQVVAGLGLACHEAAPDPTLPYGGLWDGVLVTEGRARIPEVPGVGFERKANLFAVLEPLGRA